MDPYAGQPKEYIYRGLKRGQIRILHLQPGETSDTIFVEITHELLDQSIAPYHALSWEWGSGPPTEIIRIKDKESTDSKVWTMKIKPNLSAALKQLRWRNKIRRLWVDAICIDQIVQSGTGLAQAKRKSNAAISAPLVNLDGIKEPLNGKQINCKQVNGDGHNSIDEISTLSDQPLPSEPVAKVDAGSTASDEDKDLEKSDQISMMNKIYGQAEEVSVWLGEERDDSSKGMKLIERLVKLKDFDTIAGLENNIEGSTMANDLVPLIRLLKRGWFGRRWVVQVSRSNVHCDCLYANDICLGNCIGSACHCVLRS
jgi:hypothetical protein